jgi:hypothetical protein
VIKCYSDQNEQIKGVAQAGKKISQIFEENITPLPHVTNHFIDSLKAEFKGCFTLHAF